jgi:hypothetical protein
MFLLEVFLEGRELPEISSLFGEKFSVRSFFWTAAVFNSCTNAMTPFIPTHWKAGFLLWG